MEKQLGDLDALCMFTAAMESICALASRVIFRGRIVKNGGSRNVVSENIAINHGLEDCKPRHANFRLRLSSLSEKARREEGHGA